MATRSVWLLVFLLGSSAAFAQNEVTVSDAAASEPKLDLGHTKAKYFSHPVTISAGDSELKDVHVELLDLTHENGSNHAASFEPEAVPAIAAKGTLRGIVSAVLPIAGTYSGILVVRSNAGEVRYMLSVTRDAAEPQIAVDDLGALLTNFGDKTVFTTNVRALGGKPLRLERPVIRAKRVVKDDVNVKANATIETTSVPTATTAPAAMQFEISGLDEPAKYEAVVTFTPEDGVPVEKSATIFVRRSAVAAGLWILAGVLISMALRYYWTRRRPRLMIERIYLAHHERIAGIQNTATERDVLDVIAAVRTQLNDAWNGLVLEDKWEATTTAFDIPLRKIRLLEKWAAEQERVAKMRPEALRDALTAKLAPVAQALRTRVTTAEELAEPEKTMTEFPAVAAAEIKKAINEAVESLRQLAGDLDRARGLTIVANITADLQAALDAKDNDGAMHKYDDAVATMVRVAGEELRKALEKEPASLRDNVAGVLANAKGPHALDELLRALELYIRGAAARIEDAAARDAIEKNLANKKIVEAWKQLDAALSPQKTSGGQEAVAPESGPWTATRPRFSEPGVFAPLTGTLRENFSAVTRGDLLASAASALFALLLGLKALWFDALSWGSLSDIAIAVLWGAGLHGFTFDGMATLVAKLRGQG